MAKYTPKATKLTGSMLLGALTAGAIAAAGLGSAPTANATCASFFGIGNSASCTSSQTSIAIAIGNGATASATGLFGAAFAMGTDAHAKAFAGGFNGVVAIGDQNSVAADYFFTFAAAVGGQKATATAGGPGALADFALNLGGHSNTASANGLGSLALNLFGTTTGAAFTDGVGNVAVNVGGYYAGAQGNFNSAVNLLSKGTQVQAFVIPNKPETLSSAFAVLGSNNIVSAGYGPLAIAGSIFQNGATATQLDGVISLINAAAAFIAARLAVAWCRSPTRIQQLCRGAGKPRRSSGISGESGHHKTQGDGFTAVAVAMLLQPIGMVQSAAGPGSTTAVNGGPLMSGTRKVGSGLPGSKTAVAFLRVSGSIHAPLRITPPACSQQ